MSETQETPLVEEELDIDVEGDIDMGDDENENNNLPPEPTSPTQTDAPILPTPVDIPVDESVGEPSTKKRKKETVSASSAIREEGKSLLPFSRVQKIIKADRDIPIMAREATHLVSLATEEFIKRLCEAGYRYAERDKRSTVQQKDLANVVRRSEEFFFLDEIIKYTGPDATTKRVPKGMVVPKSAPEPVTAQTFLDKFVSKAPDADSELEQLITNEDGTMYSADNNDEDDEQ